MTVFRGSYISNFCLCSTIPTWHPTNLLDLKTNVSQYRVVNCDWLIRSRKSIQVFFFLQCLTQIKRIITGWSRMISWLFIIPFDSSKWLIIETGHTKFDMGLNRNDAYRLFVTNVFYMFRIPNMVTLRNWLHLCTSTGWEPMHINKTLMVSLVLSVVTIVFYCIFHTFPLLLCFPAIGPFFSITEHLNKLTELICYIVQSYVRPSSA